MASNDLGIALKNCTMRWTKTAAECYKNGLQCKICQSMPEDLKHLCRMKPVVLELVRLYGKPKKGITWDERENN